MAKKKPTTKPVELQHNTTKLAHSVYGPSSSERFLNCAASIQHCADLPPAPDSIYSKEGNDAHDVLEIFIKNGKNRILDTRKFLYQSYPKDMVDHGFKTLLDIDDMTPPGASRFAEQEVDISHFTEEGQFGTLDCAIVLEFEKLIIIDYKYGAGVPVEVENNTQLIAYALGAAKKYDYNFERVELVIIQPRCDHKDGTIRKWEISLSELLSWEDKFRDGVTRTKDPLAEFNYGEKWCRFCPGKTTCPAISSQALTQAQIDFAPEEGVQSLPNPETIAIKHLPTILEAFDKIETWIDAVRAHAYHVLDKGGKVPGWKLVPKESRRKWIDEEKAKREARRVFGDRVLSDDLLSPAAMEKVVKGEDRLLGIFFKKHVTSISSGLKIARDNDPRQATSSIEKDFSITEKATKIKKGKTK